MAFSDLLAAVKTGADTVSSVAKTVAPIVDVIGTGFSVYDAFNQGKAAADAAKASGAATAQQLALADKQMRYGEQGGEALKAALASWVDQAGSSGMFNPEQISKLAGQYAAERGIELNDVLAKSQLSSAYGNAATMAGYNDYLRQGRDISNPYRASAGDQRTAADLGISLPTADTRYREGTQDALVNNLATGYLDRFTRETDRVLRDLYANQEVDAIRKGMDRSTYDLEAKKATADVAARRRNQDITGAIEAAMAQAGKRIGLDTSVQNAQIADATAGLARSGRELDIYKTGMSEDELNKAFQEQNFSQLLRGINTASGQMSNAQSLYQNNQNFGTTYTGALEGLRPQASNQAWNQAYDDFGKLQGLRGTTQSQLSSLVTDPYKFMASGATQAGSAYNNAASAYNTLAGSYNTAAQRAGTAAGSGLARFADWKSVA